MRKLASFLIVILLLFSASLGAPSRDPPAIAQRQLTKTQLLSRATRTRPKRLAASPIVPVCPSDAFRIFLQPANLFLGDGASSVYFETVPATSQPGIFRRNALDGSISSTAASGRTFFSNAGIQYLFSINVNGAATRLVCNLVAATGNPFLLTVQCNSIGDSRPSFFQICPQFGATMPIFGPTTITGCTRQSFNVIPGCVDV